MTISTTQLYFILNNTPATQNIMLIGKHGIGKSRILEDYFNSKGAKVVTLFLGQMSDPGDLIGLPEKNTDTGKTDFMLPYWFPVDGKPIVLFLDELNRARPEVLQTIMDLTLNRKLAGKKLPEGSRIISAVNNGSDYQLTDLDPALVSRFNIYEFEPTVEDWLCWAESSGIDSRVTGFIRENPEYLDGTGCSLTGENLERTADRRSWERISAILENIPGSWSGEVKALLSGVIGQTATVALFDYVMKSNVITGKDILTDNFEDYMEALKKLNISEITNLNSSVFKFVENYCTLKKEKFDCDKKTIAENLEKYFDFLFLLSKEYQMHFISLCSANEYPETLVFITKECGELYQKILSSVED